MVADESATAATFRGFRPSFAPSRCLPDGPVRRANYSGAFSKMLLPGPCHVQVLGDLVLSEVTMPKDDSVKGGGYELESLNG